VRENEEEFPPPPQPPVLVNEDVPDPPCPRYLRWRQRRREARCVAAGGHDKHTKWYGTFCSSCGWGDNPCQWV
jgi:hypothetical protein